MADSMKRSLNEQNAEYSTTGPNNHNNNSNNNNNTNKRPRLQNRGLSRGIRPPGYTSSTSDHGSSSSDSESSEQVNNQNNYHSNPSDNNNNNNHDNNSFHAGESRLLQLIHSLTNDPIDFSSDNSSSL
jgi:hypothetical protein